jgi:ribonuclease HI
MTNTIQIYFDGLCEPKNPGGIPVYAFIVYHLDSGQILGEEAGLAGEPWRSDVTHNLAEYTAAIRAVKWVKEHVQTKELLMYGDSELVIRQLNKVYKVKSQRIRLLFDELIGQLEGLSWKAIWVPREKNFDADKLANEFYRDYCITHEGKVMPTMRETGAID